MGEYNIYSFYVFTKESCLYIYLDVTLVFILISSSITFEKTYQAKVQRLCGHFKNELLYVQ